jgi:hypothetical protein
MPRITDLDDVVRNGTVSLRRGDIPVGLRWTGSTGETLAILGGRRRRDKSLGRVDFRPNV